MPGGERGTFALLTPPGEGGIAVFAVEGPGARAALLAAVRAGRLAKLKPGELAYGKLVSAFGEVLDEVIVAALPPRTPPNTGRRTPATAVVERFELNCHAGGAAAAAAAERLAELGLMELAEPPGEPGLSPAEAAFRRALREARTRRQLEALVTARAAGRGLDEPRLRAVLATHRVVIAGPTNAGKSTLFNWLAGADRAITSPHPGTTRDAVLAEVSVRGLAVELVDTAGLGRLPGDELAGSAQELAREEAAQADLVLLVLDGSVPLAEAERADAEGVLRGARRAIVVTNKSDLPGPSGGEKVSDTFCAKHPEGPFRQKVSDTFSLGAGRSSARTAADTAAQRASETAGGAAVPATAPSRSR